jgi:cell division transport system permease protein
MENKFIALRRIVKAGFNNFWRNGWLTAATVSVLIITLFMIFSLVMVSVLTEAVVLNLQNRVDVSIYFTKDAKEPDILQIKTDLLAMKEVKSAEYISEDDALINFREKHSDNEIIIQSLDALEDNPLEASINIKANEPDQFKTIVDFLESKEEFKTITDKINYYENQEIISRLDTLVSSIRKIGFTATAILSLVAFLVAFNTIRITIFTMKNEIGIMKLVGAGNWFVRGPFVIEGVLYGIVSSFLTMILALPMLYISSPYIAGFFSGVDLFDYVRSNFIQIWLILLFIGSVIGSLGSVIAMQRYLKV